MKLIRFSGYFFISVSVLLIAISFYFDFFEDDRYFKFFLPVASIGLFLLSYDAWVDNKNEKEQFNRTIITYEKNFYLTLLLAILLLFLTIII